MILEFGGVLDVVKALCESQVSELRCGGYLFLREFCCWEFKQIAKLGFGRKIQLSAHCVHPWAKGTGYTSKHENASNLVHINYILTTNNNYRKLMICRKYVLDNEWTCKTVFH
jgi:hypothetical protein